MQDRRNRLREHIRAAREWLGQAEHSLQHEKDVQGDLKLMLAKAELKRAEETGKQGRVGAVFLRFVPLVAAGAIALGMFYFASGWNAEPSVLLEPSAVTAVQEPLPKDGQTQQSVDGVASEVAAPQPAETDAPLQMEEMQPLPAAEPVLPKTPAWQAEPEAAPQQAEPEQAPVEQSGIPSRDMQQLMQSAGQILRAQE